jgi:putative SOS response-associated peptidase YedK
MPVILPPGQFELWLDPGFSNTDELSATLKPFESKQMKKTPVSDRVNSPANDDEECAKEVPSTPMLI